MSVLQEALRHVDVSDSRFWVAVIAIIFNPLFWNVLFSDVLSITVAMKMGAAFTLQMQGAWTKFLAVVVAGLSQQYH